MPTAEQLGFWAAIRANPDDDTPRLVYADWLEEHGDEPRAEFIRLQIEQTLMFSPSVLCSDPNERRMTRREKQLIARHTAVWLRPIVALLETGPGSSRVRFERIPYSRGFARNIVVPVREARYLVLSSEIEPLQDLRIADWSFGGEDERIASLAEIAACPHSRCVRAICAREVTASSIAALVGGHLSAVETLELLYGTLGDAGVLLLANWPQGVSLRTLNLRDNGITDAGANALAESPYLGRLNNLYLHQNDISSVARQRLRERFGAVVSLSDD